jgi:hypothetical protein
VQRRRLGLLGVVLALVVAVGCDTRSGSSATARDAELTKASFASSLADAQQKAKTVHVEAHVTAMGRRFTMIGDVVGATRTRLDFRLSGPALGGTARVILVDDVLCLRVPGLTRGARCFSLDIDRSNHPAARMLEQMLDQLQQLDPARAMKAFQAAVALDKVGTAKIEGIATIRYAVAVNTRRALRAANLDGLVPVERLPRTITYDVWVDARDLVRRMRTTVHGATITMTFSRWGQPVDIAAPPADLTTLMPGLGRLHEPASGG